MFETALVREVALAGCAARCQGHRRRTDPGSPRDVGGDCLHARRSDPGQGSRPVMTKPLFKFLADPYANRKAKSVDNLNLAGGCRLAEAPITTIQYFSLQAYSGLEVRNLVCLRNRPRGHAQHDGSHFVHAASNACGRFHPLSSAEFMEWEGVKHSQCSSRLLVQECLPDLTEHWAWILGGIRPYQVPGSVDRFYHLEVALSSRCDFLAAFLCLLSHFRRLTRSYMVGADDGKDRSSGLEPGRGVGAVGRSKGTGRRREHERHETDRENYAKPSNQQGCYAIENPCAGFHWFSDTGAHHGSAVGSRA